MHARLVLLLCCWSAYASAAVVTSPAPADEPLSQDYEVQAGGQRVPVYTARVLDPPFADKNYDYGGNYSFANVDTSGPLEVRIHSHKDLSKTVIRPESAGARTRLEGTNTLFVSLPGPRKMSIEPDGKKGPLLLFANSVEAASPDTNAPNLVYFGPGTFKPGRITLTNNQILYLAGGAVVKGGIVAEGENIRITGRGILDGNDWEWRNGPTPHVISIRGTNIEVSGITIRGASHWTIVPVNSQNVVIRDVKICGGRVQNDDGINPCNSQDVLIADCFIRSDDDCVALKGLDLKAPANNVEGITVQNSVLWCDRARIFLLGHESRAAYMRDIALRDLDIIHSTATPFVFEPGEEMRLQNVRVENVRIHGEGQAVLICLNPVVNQYMQNKVPGHVSDVFFRDISVEGAAGRYAVVLAGADAAHAVRTVGFENVRILNEPLQRSSTRLRLGNHTSGVLFTKPALSLQSQNPNGEFTGWNSFSETSGTRTGDVWKLQADGVLVCKGSPRGYLHTTSEYTNAIISFEWRYPPDTKDGKGGALVRMTGRDAVWPKCLEFQLNQGQAGDFWAIGDYVFSGPEPLSQVITNSPHGVLRHAKRCADYERPAGQWNSFEGIVDGSIAIQKINGRTVNEATGCEVIAGKVLLTSEGQEIHFRNVRITPLD